MVLMFQKELAERIVARKIQKNLEDYQFYAMLFFNKKKLLVSKNNFFPIPKVDAIV